MTTGIVRKIDELGRIVLPMELRRTLGISTYDEMEIYTDGDSVILKKHEQACIFCGSVANLSSFHGKKICRACRQKIAKMDSPSSAR